MADAKISALTALTGASVAADDVLPIVDTSATTAGSKKIRADELATYMRTAITPGSTTQIVFNDGGTLAGESGLVFDKTNDIITAGQLWSTSAARLYYWGIEWRQGARLRWSSSDDIYGTLDTGIYRDAARTLAIGSMAATDQTVNIYGSYTDATNYQRSVIKVARESSGALSGATYVSTITIPAYAMLVGVTTRVTTLITGATSYSVGDGSDVDLWGATIGVSVGSQSRTANFTAVGAVGVSASARNVTLTANGSNFTGGVVELCLHYIHTEAD